LTSQLVKKEKLVKRAVLSQPVQKLGLPGAGRSGNDDAWDHS
jgi:hypothetical protein